LTYLAILISFLFAPQGESYICEPEHAVGFQHEQDYEGAIFRADVETYIIRPARDDDSLPQWVPTELGSHRLIAIGRERPIHSCNDFGTYIECGAMYARFRLEKNNLQFVMLNLWPVIQPDTEIDLDAYVLHGHCAQL